MELYSSRSVYCKYDRVECKKLITNVRNYLVIHDDLYYFKDDESDDQYVETNGTCYGVSFDYTRGIHLYSFTVDKKDKYHYEYKSLKVLRIKLGLIDREKIK